jgi:hypothetical protein
MIVPRQREELVQELVIAELLARRGQGPLALRQRPRSRPRAAAATASPELASSGGPGPSTTKPGR